MFDLLAELGIGDEILREPHRLVPPDSWVGHIPFVAWLVRAIRPRQVVELGTHTGNSYFAICEALGADRNAGRAFAVDTWHGDEHAGWYGDDVFAAVQAVNADRFSGFSTLIRSTFDDARRYFPDGSIDLLHIDGLHTFDAVRHDFDHWRSALSDRAVVMLHDINVRERDFGVWRLWDDLVAEFPAFAFDHSHGLGVLAVGENAPFPLRRLIEATQDPERAAALRRVFATLGSDLVRRVALGALRASVGSALATDAADPEAVRLGVEHLRRERDELRADRDGIRQALDRSNDGSSWLRDALARSAELARVKDAQIAWFDGALRNRDAMLRDREVALLAREEAIDSRDRIINGQRSELLTLAREPKLDRDAGPAIPSTVSLQQATEQVRLAEARIEAAYRDSTSWRVTRPLRAAMHRLGRGDDAPLAGRTPAAFAVSGATSEDVSATVQSEESHSDSETPTARALHDQHARARMDAFLSSSARLDFRAPHEPDVSVILVLFNAAPLTYLSLASLAAARAADAPHFEIVVVDNGSTDETDALLAQCDGIRLVRHDFNLHFLRAVNEAARHARGRHLLLLNNDAEIAAGALGTAVAVLEGDPTVGAVGGRLILPDGTLQEAGSIIWRDGTCVGYGRGRNPNDSDFMFSRDVDFCSGALLMTPRATWERLGGFDERYAPAYYEETDYCVRLHEAGLRVVYHPDVVAFHAEFGSADAENALALQGRNWATFREQHALWLSRQHAPTETPEIAAFRRHRPGSRRVLVIEDRVPHPALGSGYPRSAHLIAELVALGVEVTLFPTFRHPETWAAVRRTLDARVAVLLRAEASQLRPFLVARRGAFDAILVCRPHNMRFLLEAVEGRSDLIGGVPLLYDAESVFERRAILERQTAGFPVDEAEAESRIAAEMALARRADIVTSVSPAEVASFRSFGVTDVRLLGHALDPEPTPGSFVQRDGFVFLGAIHDDNAPNADAVRWFATAILPALRRRLNRPELRLRVVGLCAAATVRALDGDAIDLLGPVEDPTEIFDRARVFVVPTRFAAGIPHKVHHAAALGIPIVATALIADQLGWRDETELLIAESADDFAVQCARLHEQEALWEQTRECALERMTSDCSPAQFRDTLRALLGGVRAEPEPAISPVTLNVPWSPTGTGEPFAGRAEGDDWAVAVPFAVPPPSPADPAPIAVLCHLFYPDLAHEIATYLGNLPIKADLFLSTDDTEKQARIAAAFKDWRGGDVTIRVFPNRGRDIAPRLVGFRDVFSRYDITLHLHSKKSVHAPFLALWRAYLLETMLGSVTVVQSVLAAFARLPRLGIVAPQHFEAIRPWISWNGNFPAASEIAARMDIALDPTRVLDFPSGSMFWARSAALRPLLDLGLGFDDFPDEAAQKDGTVTHGIERLFFHVCERSGYDWMKIADPALLLDVSRLARIDETSALDDFMRQHGVRLLDGKAPAPRPVAPPPATRDPPGLAIRAQRSANLN